MNTLVVSQARNSGRKKSEMDNVIETLCDAGLEPTMSRATRDVFAWVTSCDLITCLGTDQLDYHRVIAALEDTIIPAN